MTWAALVDLDLALLYAERSEWTSVHEFAGEALPMLESLKLHRETLCAVEMLAECVRAREIPPRVLRQLRDRLEQDPLTHLA